MARFKKGQSGNPAGRPCKNQATAAQVRERLANDIDSIIDVVKEQALAGDMQAARLLLERVCPALKPQQGAISVPLPTDSNMAEMSRAIVFQAAQGEIAPDTAKVLLDGLAAQAKIVETSELINRIEALEQKTHEPKS